jgi:hypothetical protein
LRIKALVVWAKGFYLANIVLEYHPRARLSGDILEDKRVWGAIDYRFGSQAQHVSVDLSCCPRTDVLSIGASLIVYG